MDPLHHIATKVENTATEVWEMQRIVISDTAVVPLLREVAWISCQTQTHYYVSQISGEDNKEADMASWLTHMPISNFLKHFNSTFNK